GRGGRWALVRWRGGGPREGAGAALLVVPPVALVGAALHPVDEHRTEVGRSEVELGREALVRLRSRSERLPSRGYPSRVHLVGGLGEEAEEGALILGVEKRLEHVRPVGRGPPSPGRMLQR